MNSLVLGKTLKAMYKLSGKTLTQLSEETGLTIDTINNLFYARIQKPGLIGVNTLINAMGYSMQQLMAFLDENPDLPDDCDVTELFTSTLCASEGTPIAVTPAKDTVQDTKNTLPAEIEILNAEHEKQLDRFRATHIRYVEQLQEQHDRQIEQMQAHNRNMEQHFNYSVAELRALHAQETDRLEKENVRLRKNCRWLSILMGIETSVILLIWILDFLNKSIGWLH